MKRRGTADYGFFCTPCLRWAGLWLTLLLGSVGHAQPMLVDEYPRGREAYERGDYLEARRVWLPLALEGDLRAQFGLGNIYYYGYGINRDYQQSAYWFELSAAQGLPAAQYNLGNAYRHGHGVEQDDAEAIRWWKLAADQGLTSAQFNIGTQYYYGRGVEKDHEEAVRWYQMAADQGHVLAQEILLSIAPVAAAPGAGVATASTPDAPVVASVKQTAVARQGGPAVVPAETVAPESPSQPEDPTSRMPASVEESAVGASAAERKVAEPAVAQPRAETPAVTERPLVSERAAPARQVPRSPPSERQRSPSGVRLYGADWLLQQSADHYTIQLAAMSDEARVARYLNDHSLDGDFAVFSFRRAGKPLYVLVYGTYASMDSAEQAIEALPKSIRKNSPWLRRLQGIQELITTTAAN